jgi:hypothetical protein
MNDVHSLKKAAGGLTSGNTPARECWFEGKPALTIGTPACLGHTHFYGQSKAA